MSENISKNVTGDVVDLKAENGRPSLVTDYPSLQASVEHARQKYLQDKRDYFNTLADEPELLQKTRRWKRSASEYLRWAGTLFNAYQDNQEQRQMVLDIMDKVAKDAQIMFKNTCNYSEMEIEKAKPEEKEETRDRMDNEEYAAGAFARNAVKTQITFQDLFVNGKCYVPERQREEIEASARAAEFREKVIPRDVMYLPGRIIPPHPVPQTERVPQKPDPYELAKNQPVEAYEFDRSINEIVIKKGYVSEDGLIDDESLKYDMENMKCTMKYRGGVPVTWDLWKPKDTRDVLTRDSWAADYLIRSYRQYLEDEEFGILKRKDYEEEVPPYNVKPDVRG